MSYPKACVMGWPVSQSRSPLIHGYWLKLHGLDGAYERAEVTAEDFSGFVTGLICNFEIRAKVGSGHGS